MLFFLFLLGEAVLTSTINLCFGPKIKITGIPLYTPVYYNKSGVQGGTYCTFHGHVFFSDEKCVAVRIYAMKRRNMTLAVSWTLKPKTYKQTMVVFAHV